MPSASKRALEWMLRVKQIPCRVCLRMGLPAPMWSHAHHAFDTASRSDYLTIALCPEHHQGATGFHHLGQREFERRYKTTEAKLLADTIEALNE